MKYNNVLDLISKTARPTSAHYELLLEAAIREGKGNVESIKGTIQILRETEIARNRF